MAKVIGKIKVTIPAGKATPAAPLGPALGQKAIPIMDFCKAFNAATGNLPPEQPVPTIITCFADKTFSFVTKKPTVSYMLKKALDIEKGLSNPGRDTSIYITMDQVQNIANDKMVDLNAFTPRAATKIVLGSARSMGVLLKK